MKRATISRIGSSFRPYRSRIAIVAMAIVVVASLGVVNPLLIKVIFDTALFCGKECPRLNRLAFLAGLMVAVSIVSAVIALGELYVANVVGQRVMRDYRNALYSHLQDMSLRFFTATRTGEIQSRLSSDVAGVQAVVTDTLSNILFNIVTILSTLAAMVIISWQLTVLSLSLMPLFLWLTHRAGKARRELAAATQKSVAEISAIAGETLSVSGILLSKAFGRKRFEVSRFRKENERLTDLQIRKQMIGRFLFTIVGMFFSVTPAFLYVAAGFAIAGRTGLGNVAITPGAIVAFTVLQARLFTPLGLMLQVSLDIQSSMALFDRIFEYLDLRPEIVDAPFARTVPKETIRGRIRFRSVSFSYDSQPGSAGPRAAGEGRRGVLDPETFRAPRPASTNSMQGRTWALEEVDLEIEPGQLAALVGRSGAGKSSVTYLLPRIYDTTVGSVEIDDIDVREIKLDSLGDIIGMVTQETYLFHLSIRENLLYGNPDATEAEIVAAARAAFIHDRILELPEGYHTVVGERGYRMSGGEKQRLAIARVILKNPRILILDEATSSLDTTSERLVQEALRPLLTGRTTVAVAHRLSTILAADVIFVLDRGRVVERGSHPELLRQGGLYSRLFQQQFEGGMVEAVTEDGVVLVTGEVISRAK
jgi:ATP-binding cassette, subfamily B, bacterial